MACILLDVAVLANGGVGSRKRGVGSRKRRRANGGNNLLQATRYTG